MTVEPRRTRVTRTVRAFVEEVREYGRALWWFAFVMLMAFLAGSVVGAFFYGVFWVAGMAP